MKVTDYTDWVFAITMTAALLGLLIFLFVGVSLMVKGWWKEIHGESPRANITGEGEEDVKEKEREPYQHLTAEQRADLESQQRARNYSFKYHGHGETHQTILKGKE